MVHFDYSSEISITGSFICQKKKEKNLPEEIKLLLLLLVGFCHDTESTPLQLISLFHQDGEHSTSGN